MAGQRTAALPTLRPAELLRSTSVLYKPFPQPAGEQSIEKVHDLGKAADYFSTIKQHTAGKFLHRFIYAAGSSRHTYTVIPYDNIFTWLMISS